MLNYITYQCTVCRRTKDVLQDKTRITPNLCIITKGCAGRLTQIGETSVATQTAPMAGVVDWYARGIVNAAVALPKGVSSFLLSTSSAGTVTLAIQADIAWVASNPHVKLQLVQRRTDDISYQQYRFIVTSPTNTISGKDSNGKNLLFSQQAIDEGRISVKVDGVPSAPSDFVEPWVPNVLQFNATLKIGTSVDVSVYSQKETISRLIDFTANRDIASSINGGAWWNIDWIIDDNGAKRYLYSCTDIGLLPKSAKFKVDGLYDVTGTILQAVPMQFVLASSPYENVDRYTNFCVELSDLVNDFNLSTAMNTFMELSVDDNFVGEVFPPYQLIKNTVPSQSSYLSSDVFTTSSAITTDTLASRLSGTKIIGPV